MNTTISPKNVPFIEKRFIDYLLVYLLVGCSGMMFFYRNDEYIIIGFLLSAFTFFFRKKQIDGFFVLTVLLYITFEVLQATWFNSFSVNTMLSTLLRIGFAYFTVKSVGSKFVTSYINVLVFSAAVSFIFYLLTFIPSTTQFITRNIAIYFKPIFEVTEHRYGVSANIILYTYNMDHVLWFRNNGPFWESGAFGVYLNIALLFNLIKEKNIFSRNNLILLIALITTQSTGSYMAMFFFLFAYFMLRRDVKYKFIYIITVGFIAVYGFFNLTFMKEKIEQNIKVSGHNTHSRFGSARSDFLVFIKSPYFGYGRSLDNIEKQNLSIGSEDHRNNGVTGMLTAYGGFMFVFCWVTYFYSFLNYVKTKYSLPNIRSLAFIMLATLLLIGFSQRIFMFPFAFAFLFIHLVERKEVGCET